MSTKKSRPVYLVVETAHEEDAFNEFNFYSSKKEALSEAEALADSESIPGLVFLPGAAGTPGQWTAVSDEEDKDWDPGVRVYSCTSIPLPLGKWARNFKKELISPEYVEFDYKTFLSLRARFEDRFQRELAAKQKPKKRTAVKK